MKKNKLHSFFASFLLVGFLIVGVQETAQSQIRIFNTTDCWIYFGAAQADDISNCDECQRPEDWVAPNGGLNIINPPCPALFQHWMYVKFGTAALPIPSLIGDAGATFNPLTSCDTDTLTDCNGNVVNTTWFFGPNGQATVILSN